MLVDLAMKLHSVPNALPFLKFWVSYCLTGFIVVMCVVFYAVQEAEKAAFLIRQYGRYSLYDRLRFVYVMYHLYVYVI